MIPLTLNNTARIAKQLIDYDLEQLASHKPATHLNAIISRMNYVSGNIANLITSKHV
jgi:hypothetical protein